MLDRLMKNAHAIYQKHPGAYLDPKKSIDLQDLEVNMNDEMNAADSQIEMARIANDFLSKFEKICRGK